MGSFSEAHGTATRVRSGFAGSERDHAPGRADLAVDHQPALAQREQQSSRCGAQLLKHLCEHGDLVGVVDVCLCEELLNRQFTVVVLRKRSLQGPMNALHAL
jgi:hypothetical protein